MKPSFIVLHNERVKEDDFSMDNPCDFCNDFSSHVIELPSTSLWQFLWQGENQYSRMPRICGTCLHEMQEALKKNFVEGMKKGGK